MASDWVIAFATVVLAIVTGWYVHLTQRLAQSAEQQIRLGQIPNLLFEVRAQTEAWLINLGPYSVYLRAIRLELLDQNGRAVQSGVRIFWLDIPAEDSPFHDWKHIIQPNGSLPLHFNSQPPHLSGNARVAFYFTYGSTGHVTHTLEVLLRATESRLTVRSQEIRLNQELPVEVSRPIG
jgi:hypothetical protein